MKTICKRTINIISGILAAVILAAAAMALSSCAGTPAKSRMGILLDIKLKVDDFYTDYGLTVDSLKIEKRQTNRNDRTDRIWVDVAASNNDMTYRASYYLYYVLYNDGWFLEGWNRSYSSYTAKHPESLKQSGYFLTKDEDYQTNIPANKPCRSADNADLLTSDEEKELISLLNELRKL